MIKYSTVGRSFFALGLIGSGLQQLVRGDFVRLIPKLPDWLPAHATLAVLVGAVLVILGGAILLGYRTHLAATVVGAMLLLTFFGQRVPEVLANPGAGFMWTNPLKVLALVGGTLLLAGSRPGAAALGRPWANRGPWLGAWFLGIFLLVCGIQHFVYAGFVDTLVPTWIPPSPRFWTYFAGVALCAGGIGVMLPVTLRPAAILSGLMIFLWVLLLHIPRALAMRQDPGETAAVFEALAIIGVAFLVAGTFKPKPQEG